MADTSERIIILSFIILMFIAIQSPSDLTGKRIGTLNDIKVEIHTSQDEYVLGEKFTATVYLVNNDSYDIWIEALHSYMIDANSLNDPEPVLQVNHVTFADKNPLIHIPANSRVTFETIPCIPYYTGEFQIICVGGTKTVLIHMHKYPELWEGELEVADPRFLPIDKNESLDMSAFRGLSSKLTALLAKGIPEIKDSYVYHSLDWQNGTAYIVLEDTSENVTRFILDQFSPHVQEKIRFLKSPAPLSQISEWRETLLELCMTRLKERGVNWTSMSTYYDGRILLDIEEITPETIDIIEEVIEGRVPPGIFVIWESGPFIELNEQDIDSIELRAESFVKNLNLSDVGYEITLESENVSEALIYFRVRGERIPFMTISHVIEQENELVEQWTRHRASPPSRSIEIVDFKIKEQRIDHHRILEIINPLVSNLGNRTAYVARVKTVISNSTHTFSRAYGSASKSPLDGIIRPGESEWLGAVVPGPGMMQDSLGEWHRILYDSLVGEMFMITIKIYDGAGTPLAERTFIHIFQ